MRNNNFSIVRKILPAFILISLLVSCNTRPEQKKTYNDTRDEINDAFGSDDTFRKKVDEAIDDFNTRLKSSSNEWAIKKDQISDDTRKSLDKLKEESSKLQAKANRLGEKTGQEADKLRREIREDYREFKKDVDDFFARKK